MIGHECRLSRTNSGGVVWVCQCGSIVDVVPLVPVGPEESQRSRRRLELTESIARARHGGHLDRVRADIAKRSDAELARIGKLIPLANRTQQHRGRWGHP